MNKEISAENFEIICKQIKQGYTSGIFTDNEGHTISWNIAITKWNKEKTDE